ncbi:MAG: flagellar biosynthesis anti-sigma factor FlgM [Phycisphaerae bacterium]|nr:flagellar biosynthesis anti-sigma factor FlgM [Phycisphaerae bacterium]
MANIFGVTPPNATAGIEPAGQLRPKSPTVKSAGVTDTVEISTAGKLAAKINDQSLVRMDLVQRIKSEIAAGTYETPARIDATVDRLLEELTLDI